MTTINVVPLTTDGGAVWTVRAVDGPAPDALIGRPIAAPERNSGIHIDCMIRGPFVGPDPRKDLGSWSDPCPIAQNLRHLHTSTPSLP